MTRRQHDPLRPLTDDERSVLDQISRARAEPAGHVERARILLAVAAGHSFTAAARAVGRRSNDAVAKLVTRFNCEGVAAVAPRHAGGPPVQYGAAERERILAEFRRTPNRAQDGTATWSLTTLQAALRNAPDGLPHISTFTIWWVLRDAGYTWQLSRTWCPTGTATRKRKAGRVDVTDPDTTVKKNLIEDAYRCGEALGLSVWTQDEAGPFQTVPYGGESWQEEGEPHQQAHEYLRDGTAKCITLFHPASGQVHIKGVTECPNRVLHPWLQSELSAILAAQGAEPPHQEPAHTRALWEQWQAGLHDPRPLPDAVPPLRMLLIWDNLAGHKTPAMVDWLIAHGIMPLYTPVSGSWLNMAESIQRILKRRALDGQHPTSTDEIIAWFEAVAQAWNRKPTPFEWGGKRAARRARRRVRRHAQGGSGACTHRPVPRLRRTKLDEWRHANQVTH